jgi:hypothetical protein
VRDARILKSDLQRLWGLSFHCRCGYQIAATEEAAARLVESAHSIAFLAFDRDDRDSFAGVKTVKGPQAAYMDAHGLWLLEIHSSRPCMAANLACDPGKGMWKRYRREKGYVITRESTSFSIAVLYVGDPLEEATDGRYQCPSNCRSETERCA